MSGVAVQVNGEETTVSSGTTVEGLVADRAPTSASNGRTGRGVAVAVNGEVVPRSMWAETRLDPGDRIEILNAVGGG